MYIVFLALFSFFVVIESAPSPNDLAEMARQEAERQRQCAVMTERAWPEGCSQQQGE